MIEFLDFPITLSIFLVCGLSLIILSTSSAIILEDLSFINDYA
jgi:hypothetical protein